MVLKLPNTFQIETLPKIQQNKSDKTSESQMFIFSNKKICLFVFYIIFVFSLKMNFIYKKVLVSNYYYSLITINKSKTLYQPGKEQIRCGNLDI